MNTNEDTKRESLFVEAGRFLGRSPGGRVLLSMGVAVLFCCVAYAAWHDRELTALVVAVGLVVYGLQLAWNLLPISEATRNRWRRDRQTAERCRASQYRFLLWAGISVGIAEWLGCGATKSNAYVAFIVPGAFIAAGVVSYILCRRFVRNERKT